MKGEQRLAEGTLAIETIMNKVTGPELLTGAEMLVVFESLSTYEQHEFLEMALAMDRAKPPRS